jgi:hypothetical protein
MKNEKQFFRAVRIKIKLIKLEPNPIKSPVYEKVLFNLNRTITVILFNNTTMGISQQIYTEVHAVTHAEYGVAKFH